MIRYIRPAARVVKASVLWVWGMPQRLAHPAYRAIAKRRLVRRRPIRSAVFVCHGNVCRSPFAAAVFDRLMNGETGAVVTVTSAGFIGPGRRPPARALEAGARRDYDLTSHRSSLIDAARAANDLVVVMTTQQAQGLRARFSLPKDAILVLGDLDPEAVVPRTIRDPWGCEQPVFEECFDRVERCVAELARIVG